MMRWLMTMAMILSFYIPAHAKEQEQWIVYYADKAPSELFLPYDVIVFDSVQHPALAPLKDRGKTVLGYISLGEAEEYRSDFQFLKKQNLLVQRSKEWPDHHYVDVRNPAWIQKAIDETIPNLLQHGFDGIMIDTLDSPLLLEEKYPQKYKGMSDAVVRMIKAIRMHYPTIKIMVNRGFEVLPQIANDIDMVLAESTYTTYDFDKKVAVLQPKDEHEYYVEMLKSAQKIAPSLKIYTLDYWDMQDRKGVQAIYDLQRKYGFTPYVTTVDLEHIHVAP